MYDGSFDIFEKALAIPFAAIKCMRCFIFAGDAGVENISGNV
jgi:hypothetical protein